MKWRLGLDIGTNSIGWWAFRVGKVNGRWRAKESLDGGVLIFPDGREPQKSGRVGDSLAVARRIARGMRRNRDHGRNRMAGMVEDLIGLGLLPEDAAARDALFQTPKKRANGKGETGKQEAWDAFNPYRLRAEALERPLSAHELGRALLHLGLRRGFKSNRKEASDEDGGKLKVRIDGLRQTLNGQTLGQYLWAKFQAANATERAGGRRGGIRFRAEEDFYPDRAMVAEEFQAIRARQEPHHDLSAADWERLRERYILFQWPLKPVERGVCEFFMDQPRHWRDTPIGHEFRIYQELNALRWVDAAQTKQPLDGVQRAGVLTALMTRKSDVKFASLLKLKHADKSALFPDATGFNLEAGRRQALKPHRIAVLMAADPVLAPLWAAYAEHRRSDVHGDTPAELDDIFETLHAETEDARVQARLEDAHGLTAEQARALMALPLATGTAQVSRAFMEQIVPVLRDQGLVYSEAVTQLCDADGNPLHHSLRDDGRRWDRLPYYGAVMPQSMLGADPTADAERTPEKRFGKFNNPTVHVALNQLRRLVNHLSERFGAPPVEIHVELTRDLKSSRQKRDEHAKQRQQNERENNRIRAFCAEHGAPEPSARDIKKVKLWEELSGDQFTRQCVFSGRTISAAQLFNGEAEIEHLLPFSRTLDDSMANLTVALPWANRLKGNNSPHEAFSNDRHADRGIFWHEVLARAAALPGNKRWRFAGDAMARFEETGHAFIARQLNDTAHIARVAQRYLRALDGVEQVVPNPGRLTALIRGKWGFNGLLGDDNLKDRTDHRHHAIDAAVIGLTDRAVLQNISRLTARGADDRVHLAVPELDDGIRSDIRARVRGMVVAYKPDHGLQGRLFNDTAYGFVDAGKRDPDLPEHTLVTRKPLASLTPTECGAIRDRQIRDAVWARLEDARRAGEKHDAALADFAKTSGIQKVRVLVTNQTVMPVPSAPHKGYAPDSYVCCDIWRLPRGKKGKWKKGAYVWHGVFWSYAETAALAPGAPDKDRKKPHPAAKFVMRVFKNDMVAWNGKGGGGREEILRVAGFSTTNNRLDVRPHAASGSKQIYISINVLGAGGMRKYVPDPDGRPRRRRTF